MAQHTYRIGGHTLAPVSGARVDDVDAAVVLNGLEQRIGCRLPDDYRGFVATTPQSGFAASVVIDLPPDAPQREVAVDVMFGIDARRPQSIGRQLDVYGDRLPPRFMPIASDPGGNLLCLALADGEYGNVFWWDHSHREWAPEEVKKMSRSVAARGVDVNSMSIDQIIVEWELRNARHLQWSPGRGNLYHVAASFLGFVEQLREADE